jgi:predicted RNase H-like HicB family nuclease
MSNYTIKTYPPQNKNELWGVRCEELKLNASGETEQEAFYNLIENIPVYFEIKNETDRHLILSKNKKNKGEARCFQIPAFA